MRKEATLDKHRRRMREAAGVKPPRRSPQLPPELRRGLTERQVSELQRLFKLSTSYQRLKDRERLNSPEHDDAWLKWCRWILGIQVDFRPGGWAVLKHPARGHRVGLEWEWIQEKGVHRLREVHVKGGEDFLTVEYLDLRPYVVAFTVRVLGRKVPEAFRKHPPRRRPEPGKPFDQNFYRDVVRIYDDLMASGHKQPATELARRMDANPATVRSWIRRGKDYLKEGER